MRIRPGHRLFATLAVAAAVALALPMSAATGASGDGGPGGHGNGHGNGHGHGHGHGTLSWTQTVLDPDQNFRGLDGVNRRVAWVTGESVSEGPGKVFRTTDGGKTWTDVSPADTTGLSFRDVEATGPRRATILAIGPGDTSRIYRTTDGGATWTEAFRNPDENAFYDCMAFYPGHRVGLALSDPVDGKFRILRTTDGGASWSVLPNDGMPDSTGEGGFAASGDCLTIRGRTAVFGSGGAQARIFTSRDFGMNWTAVDSTIPAGDAAGVFAIALGHHRAIAVGGDFAEPTDGVDASAYLTRDGTWANGGDLTHVGEDVAWVGRKAIAVGNYGGAAGSSVSTDGGRSWQRFSDVGWHAIDCSNPRSCWVAGPGGTVGWLTRN